MPETMDAQALWIKAKGAVLNRVDFNLTIADALNAVKPITVDGDQLVLGLAQGELHHAGILSAPDKRNTIEKALQEAVGRAMSFQFIEGTTLQEWEYVKQRKERAATHVESSFAGRKQQTAAAATIDEFSQELHRRFSALEGRGFPQVKAKWMLDIIPLVVEAEERLRTGDETFYRSFARVIDKVSSLTDIPAVIIALEIERHKRAKSG